MEEATRGTKVVDQGTREVDQITKEVDQGTKEPVQVQATKAAVTTDIKEEVTKAVATRVTLRAEEDMDLGEYHLSFYLKSYALYGIFLLAKGQLTLLKLVPPVWNKIKTTPQNSK